MYLVTGGAGFIGSHLVKELVARGETVRVLDNVASGKEANLSDVMVDIEWVRGDVTEPAIVRRAVEGVQVVFHQAAAVSVHQSIVDPWHTLDVNLKGTLCLLQAAREAQCRRVVFASSSAVYGDVPITPKTEGLTPCPLSPYAISKLGGEQLCHVFTLLHGLETVSLRYFNVFGPAQDPGSSYAAVVPSFLEALHSNSKPVVYGDGKQSRDFVYIDNVVHANLLASVADGVAGRVFNVGSGKAISVSTLLEHISRLLGNEISPEYAPARHGDVQESLADITAARKALGYELIVPFEEGIIRTISAYKQRRRVEFSHPPKS